MHRNTSRDAYRLTDTSRTESLVIDHLTSCADRGATCDETIAALSVPHQTVSPRFVELEQRGIIVRTSERRKTRRGGSAAVYRIAQEPPMFARAAVSRTAALRAALAAALVARDTGDWSLFDARMDDVPGTDRMRICDLHESQMPYRGAGGNRTGWTGSRDGPRT